MRTFYNGGNEDFLTHNDCKPDPVIRAIKKYEIHPSILKIKEKNS